MAGVVRLAAVQAAQQGQRASCAARAACLPTGGAVLGRAGGMLLVLALLGGGLPGAPNGFREEGHCLGIRQWRR